MTLRDRPEVMQARERVSAYIRNDKCFAEGSGHLCFEEDLAALLATVEAAVRQEQAQEIERLKEDLAWEKERRGQDLWVTLQYLRDKKALEAEVARLRAALTKYGAHLPVCPFFYNGAEADTCTCGLDALLSPERSETK